ncbi:MAG: formylmethanofuran dehydrogenase subunit E family protein [Syntrophales bacterium]|jgi:formylmethanofuran dehydrogenase subunit E|nr:formylmethanofuran dehydrogenase subunit E family protein [Syntrophales bacterium]MCK9527077.1 formylmethanofuran dehydrogenase subunit E family protein [Syntrophales bacterium]MDX9921798.1 formylmethanofuran dehydrogenase subunit E family protein [Syntrophales bacterium]
MNICTYSYEEYLHLVESFHGSMAPGLIIGGFIVDLALKNLPKGDFFDAICETPVCLPDAVQILTPCTIGNGWLTVINIGRFAVILYEKFGGEGVRVFLDTEKLKKWPEIHDWYLKKKKKHEQDSELLLSQIKDAGHDLLGMQPVRVEPDGIRRKKMGPVSICSGCGEAYPARDGDRCLGCRGGTPYIHVAPVDN